MDMVQWYQTKQYNRGKHEKSVIIITKIVGSSLAPQVLSDLNMFNIIL